MRYYEDYQVGETTVSRSRTITEADIVQFCMFSGDWYGLHADREFAGQTPFGGRIAHGLLVLSAASGLMPLLNEMAVIAFYGMDKVRFLQPTRINDTIHVEVLIKEKKEKEKGGLITLESTIKNQKGETVAIAIQKALAARKPAGEK